MHKLSIFLLTVFAVFAFVLPNSAVAGDDFEMSSGGNTFYFGDHFISDKEHQGDTVYTLSESVSVDTNNFKQLFAITETLDIKNPIEEDIYAIASDVSINADVGDDVFIIANAVDISGNIRGDTYIIASELTIQKDANIQGGLYALVGNIRHHGDIQGQSKLKGETIQSSGRFASDVQLRFEHYDFGPESQFNGKVSYYGEEYIEGLSSFETEYLGSSGSKKPIFSSTFFTRLIVLDILNDFVLALILFFLFGNFLLKQAKSIRKSPFSNLGIGFISILCSFIVLLFLAVTLVGVQTAIVCLLTLILLAVTITPMLLVMSLIFWPDRFRKYAWQKILLILLHTVLFVFILIIPIVGVVIIALAWVAIFGRMMVAIFETIQQNFSGS